MADTSKRRKGGFYPICVAHGCLNDKLNNPDVSFFRVPEDKDKRNKWFMAVGRHDLINSKGSYGICTDHFQPHCMKTVKILNPNAEPSANTLISRDSDNDCNTVVAEPKLSKECDLPADNTRNLSNTKESFGGSQICQKCSTLSISHTSVQTEETIYDCFGSQTRPRPIIDEHDFGFFTTHVHRKTHNPSTSVVKADVASKSDNNSKTSDRKINIESSSLTHKPIKVNENIVNISTYSDPASNKGTVIILEPGNTRETKYSDKNTQTSVRICDGKDLKKMERAIRKTVNYELQINSLQKQLETLRSKVLPSAWSSAELTKKICEFLLWANQIIANHKEGLYNDCNYKLFALNLYIKTRHAYKYLSDTLSLPSLDSLKTLKIPQPSQLNQATLDCLSNKMLSLPDKAKYCCLVIDSVDLNRNLYYNITADEIIGLHYIDGQITNVKASVAYFVILRGIAVDWKQLVGYTVLAHDLCYEELDSWLNDIIGTLLHLEIKIMAVTTSQELNFNRYACFKSVSIKKPFFTVNGQRIYYIFDAPHLFTCLRNDLIDHDFYYNKTNRIAWDYIKALYEYKKLKLKNALPKITEAHVEPNPTEKKDVKYAAQIFSNSVFSAFDILMSVNFIPKEANPTAQFIKTMNDLFDVLNSNKLKCDNEYQSGFTESKNQMGAITNAQTLFKSLKVIHKETKVNVTEDMCTLKNLQITAHAVVLLCRDLKKLEIKQVPTRRLNKEPADSFNKKLNVNNKPTFKVSAVNFRREFTKQFLLHLLPNSKTEKIQNNFCEMLMKGNLICDSTRITKSDDNSILQPINNEEVSPLRTYERKSRKPYADVASSTSSLATTNRKYLLGAERNNVSGDVKNDETVKRKMQKRLVSLDGNYDYRLQLPEKQALTYIASYLLYKCSKKHKCPEFDAILSKMSLLEFDEDINNVYSFSGRLKVPNSSFKDYVASLEDVFVNKFAEVVISKPASDMLRVLEKVPFREPCQPCNNFPSDYLLTLFIRLRIYLTLIYNRCNKNLNIVVKKIVD